MAKQSRKDRNKVQEEKGCEEKVNRAEEFLHLKKRRRKKKRFKDCMMSVLSLPISKKEDFEKLSKMGMRPFEMDNRTLLAASMFEKAVESGNVTAFKEICSLVGETDLYDDDQYIQNIIKELQTDSDDCD